MTEKPILMCAEMVRAVLTGQKSQTRRIIKPQPRVKFSRTQSGHVGGSGVESVQLKSGEWAQPGSKAHLAECPHGQPGDHLWVRETFTTLDCHHGQVVFRADKPNVTDVTWRPSIFMPRWASRLTLEIVSVRVERVQEISETDAMAEGVSKDVPDMNHIGCYRCNFAHLWEQLNAKRGYGWDKNPWVWAIEFRKL